MKKYILLIISILCSILLSAQCVDNGNYWNESWVSCTTSTNPNPARDNSHWILYEFQEPHAIDSTWIWNANRTGESDWGPQYVVIDYRLMEFLGYNWDNMLGPKHLKLMTMKVLLDLISMV